jgi:hypothetical protein
MVLNMLKCRLAKQNLKPKDDLEKAIKHFWNTVERCNKYIDQLYKVVPTVILIDRCLVENDACRGKCFG